ncbi:MAG TPA: bifunctional UDP-N-acetylglucosamine diphosphorylase/glucosamine-1-phosphate N-acetyltransferase GlmU [Vicinamibacterales bacterium]|nr:bifunctional UDP-N-acetylglucosamine diphosphorylase/glucosamine-1-phosphate N-acetyltransferase GlmU [Vicinamibacterales bacterium]
MTDLHVVILAAGKGTRMKSALPKVLHPLAGRPLIEHILSTVDHLPTTSTTLVVGHGADQVQTALASRPSLQYVVQSPQLGTGHALLQAEPVLSGATGNVLLLYADVPLLEPGTLLRLLEAHRNAKAAMTVLTAELPDPYGYGRIVRGGEGQIERIIEERDASSAQRAIREINSGIYALSMEPLFEHLHRLATDNSQGEYYLTDLVGLYRQQGLPVDALCLDSADELRGVNSRLDLAELSQIVRQRKNRLLMMDGVTLDDPATTFVDMDVTVGPDTVLGPGVRLEGRTVVGDRCRIHAGSRLTNVTMEDDVVVLDYSVIVDSRVGQGAAVGPMAHVRPESVIGSGARVGNFVELKKTSLGKGSKASHLTYLGDATIGEGVNIGAGTITCNYDGAAKYPTIIEDGVFIGSDSQLVAPVTVGKDAYVGAGSTIVSDVPAGSLALARGRQVIKADWAAKRKAARKATQKGGH